MVPSVPGVWKQDGPTPLEPRKAPQFPEQIKKQGRRNAKAGGGVVLLSRGWELGKLRKQKMIPPMAPAQNMGPL